MNPALAGAALFGILITWRLLRTAILRRNHRDFGGFVGYLTLASAVVLLVISFFAVPGVWERMYEAVLDLYAGD